MYEIISGEKIQLKCDYFIGTRSDIDYNPKIREYILSFPNTFIDINGNFNETNSEKCKFFCYTHILYNNLDKLVSILSSIPYPFEIYFHNSDGNFLQSHYNTLKEIKNITKIHSQNNTVKEVETLPIGQANAQWPHGNYDVLLKTSQNLKEKTNFIYFNFNVGTNRSKRQICKDVLSYLPWVPDTPYENYIELLATYKYCICPEGNGLDSHRFWECMYLDVIPICLKNDWTERNKDLPFIILDDWSELKSKLF
jgi:hypothetical protein